MQRGVEVAKEQPWGRGAEASKLGPEASSDTIIRASINKGVIAATSVREVLNNTGDDLTVVPRLVIVTLSLRQRKIIRLCDPEPL